MNGSQLSELRQIPGKCDTGKETTTPFHPFDKRERSAETALELCRFEQVSAEVIVPTLRQMMLDLQRKGHQARLQATGSGAACLDIEVRTSPARRGTIRMALDPDDPGSAWIEITSHRAHEEERVEVDRIDVVFVAGRVLALLRKLREPASARR